MTENATIDRKVETKESSVATSESHSEHHKLGEFASTAICGNDITSSCLYVSALCIGAAAQLAPLALLLVAALLFLFRKIYGEVVGALPLNGGAYNALLNTTSKARASVAACLTILSYMATAVISAGEAMHYLAHVFESLPVIPCTVLLLGAFTILTIMGITESSKVAIGIFVFHLSTLTILLVVGLCYVAFSEIGSGTLRANFAADLAVSDEVKESGSQNLAGADHSAEHSKDHDSSSQDAAEEHVHAESPAEQTFLQKLFSPAHTDHSKEFRRREIGLGSALFFGFAVALLGISGFESSSNFVEEQAPGVFPKTLRNMWWAVSFFNPMMALLALALLPVPDIQQKYQESLLANMGSTAVDGVLRTEESGLGKFFATIISIDAFLVLSGAVLTSFVGVNGLVHRMTLDRCLPQFLLKTNARGTTHRILITFFVMCVSVLFITWGSIPALAGVYTISFLSVMALFGIGNVLLKIKRAQLPRQIRAPWLGVLVAIAGVLVGLVGNAVKNPEYLVVFLKYFIPMMCVIALMLYRTPILKIFLSMVKAFAASLIGPLNRSARFVRRWIEHINSQQIVFFTRGDNIANLNNAMLYVQANEETHRMKIVTVVRDQSDVPARLSQDIEFLDDAYPEIDIEFVVIEGIFGPELISDLSRKWDVPTNLMFIGSPRGRLGYGLAELGGVRLII